MSNSAGRKKDAATKPRYKKLRPYEAFKEFCEPMLSQTIATVENLSDSDLRDRLAIPLAIWNLLYIDRQINEPILENHLDEKIKKNSDANQWLIYVYLKEKRKENLHIYNYRFTKLEVEFNPENKALRLIMAARK